MPLYEYKCEKCGDLFEVMQKFSDEPLTVHEKCGGTVHRLLSAPALQFKGSGWYITDYAKSGKSGESAKNGGGSTKKDSSAGDKSGSSADSGKSSASSTPASSESKSSSSSDK